MYVLTATDASRAATARISAQETTPGQTFSTRDLTLSMTSYPLADRKFWSAFFSLVKDEEGSNKMDASQPCTPIKMS